VPWVGALALIPVVVSVGCLVAIQFVVLPRVRRPEYWMFWGFVFVQLSAGLALVICRTTPLCGLPFLAMIMMVNAARLPRPAVVYLVAIDAAVIAGAALLMNAGAVARNPAIVAFPLALMGAMTLFGRSIAATASQHRAAASTDQLTGALNRAALQARVDELWRTDGQPAVATAVLIADLDHFKAINDEHGHAEGDRVLAEVASRLRVCVRPLDCVYRIGGEEFVVLLVGTDERAAAAVGERVRAAVGQRDIDGHQVTISVGVAGADVGSPLAYERLFAQADAALLRAKEAGRDRVVAAVTPPAVAA
jgi:diguanylate cyclase (GGDEF)-like protein